MQWPMPPFYRLAESPPPGHNRECVLELVDGRVLSGNLVEFALGRDSVTVRLAEPQGLKRIELAKIRCIKQTRAVAVVAEAAALNAIGAVAPVLHNQKSFVVALRDGTQMTGKTLGFVKEKDGLFLFLVAGNSAQVTNWFVPAGQIKNVQIGPFLGDTLVEKHVVSAETLALALNKQAKLRQERIGNYLTDRALISAEELTRALHEQGKRPNVRLGEILIEAELITIEQLEEALAIQANHRERRIGDILIEMGAVSVRLIQFALSDKLGIPYVNVREFKIGLDALETIDTAFAIRHQVLPLLVIGESLVVAVENPLAVDFAQDLRFKTGMTITPVIANPQELKVRIAKEYSSIAVRGGENRAGIAAPSETGKELRNPAPTKVADLASQLARERPHTSKDVAIDTRVAENTLVKLINKIIIEAHAQGASDIHIESNISSDTRIRFRKDGDLEDYLDLPQAYTNSLVSRIKIMAELDISEHRHPQDGKIDFGKHGPLSIELRVAIIPTANNLEDVVLRILGGAEPLPLDQVGFSDQDLEKLRTMISRSYGLILVCGPTGSG
ncbi:MAG TPA: ATPase, T2SS/T4P/T4SS family, partial [Gammaproteobacteria bacterium]|nr:ATPase, T2SS/T4P/T4SS family [Gammaproteobacteria bacterium]